MDGPTICQLILTRFNTWTPTSSGPDVRTPAWLEQRLTLFARYCVPSVRQQTHADFAWVIFCTTETPPDVLARIRAFDPRIRITCIPDDPEDRAQLAIPNDYVAPDTPLVLPSLAVSPYVPYGTELVISTRLDNDDALHRDALRSTRSLAASVLASNDAQHVYSPTIGFKLDVTQRRLFLARTPSGPFVSLLERVVPGQPLIGVHSGTHPRLVERFPTAHESVRPLWVHIVHGGNVHNRIKPQDVPVAMRDLRDEFGFSV